MRRNHSIFYHTMLLTGVNVLLRGMSMLFQVYLAGRIGAAGLGLLQLILSVGGFAMTLGISGARVAVLYLSAEEFGHRRPYGVRSAVLHGLFYGAVCSALAACALYFGAGLAAERWIGDMRAVPALRLLALSLPANTFCAILGGYFTACGRIRHLAAVEVAERLIALALTFALLYWAGDDLARACCALVLGSALAAAVSAAWLLHLFLRATTAQKPSQPLHMPSRLLRLTAPLAVSDYLRAGLSTLEQFLIPWGLARAGGSQMRSMAAYGTICGMVFPVLMFPAAALYALSDLLVPELARADAEENEARIHMLTDRCLRIGALFAAGCAAIMLALADALGELLYQSTEAGFYLRLFAPTILFLYLDAIVDGMCKGLGQQLASARYNTLTSLLDVLLLYLLLPRFGVAGYYCSFVISHLVNFALSLRRLLRVTGYRPQGVFFAKTLLCACTAGLGCFCVTLPDLWAHMAARCAVFAVLLPFMLWMTGTLSRDDTRWLRGTFFPGGMRKKSVDTTGETPYNETESLAFRRKKYQRGIHP